ncbi:dimeric dUTPase (all-alpha-NTP-PPase superfamily) [Bacillus ectoiniformans]|uniref:dUTP diphosphatase n=1 Tax=Bacillus ectoiniformans TaxID=1494429 RepID=UPI0019567E91|nr:dUTP diphosphatase [Bacillus ectoiniformans]MBM7648868.1 dimeric dUTPase (all-alpha-NTP-PPase superfamily) [Bacillus ectoiniformans]
MNLEKLFMMQKSLDQYIEEEHGLEKADLFDQKVLALLVEIGELANETRCFKFWSKKAPSERSVILEEFVDGVHFILSLGIVKSFEAEAEISGDHSAEPSITDQFLRVFKCVEQFKREQNIDSFNQLLTDYFALGVRLGFSVEEVEAAYVAKNEVNYERQQQGY